MSCDELRNDYELYALGLTGDAERAELREHLHRGCQSCTAGVRAALGVLSRIGMAVPAMAPSSRLRRRILASVGVEPRARGWFAPAWAAVSALCLVTAFYFYGRDRDNALQLVRSREQARAQSIELARLNDALALLNQPETRQVTFGGGAQPPHGSVFVNPRMGMLLLASNLPAAPAGRTYEMWVIPKTGNPVAAGLFQADPDGTALHLQSTAVDLAAAKAVAVTLEAAGGAPQPTSQPLIVAAL